jgi:hypothetical protein
MRHRKLLLAALVVLALLGVTDLRGSSPVTGDRA